MTKGEVYLDYAAATPMADFVFKAMTPYLSEKFYNPSSPYAPAVAVRREYEDAKQRIANTFGVKGDELVITAGATESINLAIGSTDGHIVTSMIEHPAVLESAKGRSHTLVSMSEEGAIDVQSVKDAITDETTLVSIALANNELGTIQPLKEISAVVEKVRLKRVEQGNTTPLLFHTDASQGFDQIDVHASRLGVDLLTLNAGKMYGPKQVGLLWIKRSASVQPYIHGGGQEQGLRSGTENVAGVMGFAAAAEYASAHQRATHQRLRELRDELENRIRQGIPSAELIGPKKHRLPGHLSIAFKDIDAERIIFALERVGVYVSTGSACSANKHSASHVLKAINLDESLINGSLRMTLGRHTTREQIVRAADEIVHAVRNEYERMQEQT